MIIFVAGIPTVGKAHIAESISDQLGVRYVDAYQVIEEELRKRGPSCSAGADLRLAILIDALKKRQQSCKTSMLVDYSFALPVDGYEHTYYKKDMFVGLEISGVVLLEYPSDVDLGRFKQSYYMAWIPERVNQVQESERENVQLVVASLGLQFLSLLSPSEAVFRNAVEVMLGASLCQQTRRRTITVFRGELDWIGTDDTPLIITNLEVQRKGLELFVCFEGGSKKPSDGGKYSGAEHLKLLERRLDFGFKNNSKIYGKRPEVPIYWTERFVLNSEDRRSITRLGFRTYIFEINDQRKYCYVECYWLDRDDYLYECQGVLNGEKVEPSQWRDT